MSKKLLMAAGEEGYKGPLVYETLIGTGIQAIPSDSNYTLIDDEPIYFDGCHGTILFNGSNMPTFLGKNMGDGTYEYRILQQSVADPTKQTITTFRLDKQLVSWTSTWYDRLYWDDTENCYMIEKNANFVRADGTDPSVFKSIDSSFTTIDVDGCPNSMSDSTPPYVTSNWTVSSRSNAVNNSWRAIIGYAWTASEIVCYMCFGSVQSTETILNVFVNNPLNATFPAHNKTASGSLSTSGVAPAEGARLEKTNLTKKIKLKQYPGGTIYSMISENSALKGAIRISIPTRETKYLPYKQTFEGTDVTIDIDDNHMVDPDGKVYLEWFKANEDRSAYNSYYWPLMGIQDDEYNFEYQIVVTPPDGSTVDPVTFKLDYQIINYNLQNENGRPRPIVEWSDELGKYIFKTSHNYIKITDLTYHPVLGAASVISTTSYSNWPATAFQYKNIPYMDNTSAGTSASATMVGYVLQEGSSCNCNTHYMGYYGYHNHVTYTPGNLTGFHLGLRSTSGSQDRTWYTTIETANEHLKNYPVELVYNYAGYETSYVTHETILDKKVELPYYGPGTKYSMQRVNNGDGVLYKAPICISVPLKYDFKIAYKVFEGYAPTVQSNDCYVVRADQNGYLVEVKGNSRLSWATVDGSYSNFTETIKLLGDKVPGGYSYKLRQTTSSGKINETAFVIQKMLAWYAEGYSGSSLPLQENLTANPMYWDILYWDSSAGRYKIEKRTEYYFADTAYGEVEFVPYSYSNYNLNQGDAWEFLALGYPNYDKSQTSNGRIYSNYATTSFAYNANVDLQYGVVFPVINGTSFGDSSGYNVFDGNGIGFRALNCTTLDALDVYLRSRPLHVITGAYYYNAARSMPFPVVDTSINKQIPIKISDSDAITGTTYTVSNGDLSAKIKIAIPVTYLDVEVPEPTYNLNSGVPQEFTTGSQYVNTGLKLFETAKDFTVLLDYMHKTSQGTFLVNNGVVFHCRYEASTSPYNYCGLSIQAGSAPTTYMYGGQGSTNYHPGIIADSTGTGQLTLYDGYSYRYRIMIVYKAGIPYKIAQVNESGDILFEYAINENHKKTFTAHSRPLYLGCQIAATSTSRSNYFKGTINECKIWEGTALTDAQIMKVIGAGPYPTPKYELVDKSLSSLSGFRTGMYPLAKAQDFMIILSFDASAYTRNGDMILSCGYHDTNNPFRFSLEANSDLKFIMKSSVDTRYSTNTILSEPIPEHNERVSVIIIFKSGVISRVIDYGGETLTDLEIRYAEPYVAPSVDLQITLGIGQMNNTDTDSNPYGVGIWHGTIYNFMYWEGSIPDDYQLKYLLEYVLK